MATVTTLADRRENKCGQVSSTRSICSLSILYCSHYNKYTKGCPPVRGDNPGA